MARKIQGKKLMADSTDTFSKIAVLQKLLLSSKIANKRMDEVFSEIDLKKSSFEVLAALLNAAPECALTPNKLMELTHITSGSMTTRIDKLSKKGWVERISNSSDKRSIKVALTDSGRSVIESAVAKHEEAVDKLLGNLTEKEQQRLLKLLSKLTD